MNTLRAHGLAALALWVGAVATGCLFDSAGLDQDAGRQDTGVDGHAGGGQGGEAAAGGNAAGGGQGGDAAAGGNAAGGGQGGEGGGGEGGQGGGAETGGSGGEGGQGGGAETGGSGGEGGGGEEGKIFETVWNISTPKHELKLPYYDDGSGSAKCDFTILWGDEGAGSDFSKGTHVTDCSIESNITHEYTEARTYHVKIKGVYNGWGAEPYTDGTCTDHCNGHVLQRLVQVVSFGSVGLNRESLCVYQRRQASRGGNTRRKLVAQRSRGIRMR